MELMTCKDELGKFLSKYKAGDIMWGFKLDGVRCHAHVDVASNTVTYMSRNGKQFKNFNCFDDALIKLTQVAKLKEADYDGEVVSRDKKFSKLMTQVHRKYDVDTAHIQFKIFDCFGGQFNTMTLWQRISWLGSAFLAYYDGDAFSESDKISILPQPFIPCSDYNGVIELCQKIVAAGYEGIVLKYAHGMYEHKRSIQWCKVKPFHTLDLPVVGWTAGTGKHKGRLGALTVEYKGVKTNVGSGFTDQEREEIALRVEHEGEEAWELNIPAIIEVRFQEITKDNSLRFPTFEKIRDDKDETDE